MSGVVLVLILTALCVAIILGAIGGAVWEAHHAHRKIGIAIIDEREE